jgi:SAM-dependent methyltransferase
VTPAIRYGELPVRYYHPEQLSRYQGVERTWSEIHSDYPDGFEHFSSRPFLEQVLPSLEFALERPRAFELGCGTSPGACFLAERGFRVDAVDLIPAAIDVASKIASERDLDIHYEVMDVTQIPLSGTRYDLVVDSYCLQGIVLDRDRKAVFAAVRARLKPSGYYLVSNSMYSSVRHRPEDIVIDSVSGKVYHGYDERCLFDPTTEVYYRPFSDTGDGPGDAPEDYEGSTRIAGRWYLPTRRYRTAQSLVSELESEGFEVLLQTGEDGENVLCKPAAAR